MKKLFVSFAVSLVLLQSSCSLAMIESIREKVIKREREKKARKEARGPHYSDKRLKRKLAVLKQVELLGVEEENADGVFWEAYKSGESVKDIAKKWRAKKRKEALAEKRRDNCLFGSAAGVLFGFFVGGVSSIFAYAAGVDPGVALVVFGTISTVGSGVGVVTSSIASRCCCRPKDDELQEVEVEVEAERKSLAGEISEFEDPFVV